jgi:hypothetical protein
MCIFMVKVPLFRHSIQGFHFCYLPNTKFIWNQLKCEKLNDSNYDNSYGDGDFSHAM